MLNEDQLKEAVGQMIIHCRNLMAFEPGAQASAREILVELGYDGEELENVLRWIASRGFRYCLDTTIQHQQQSEGPSYWACVWSIDQLESRLQCVV